MLFVTGLSSAKDRSLVVKDEPRNSQKRIALVVGNASYKKAPLKNPLHDARKMSDTLSKLGFDVITKENTNQKELERAIKDFALKLSNGNIGIFFFAGHGVEVEGRNYIIPIDAEIEDENDVKYKAVDVQMVLEKMESSRNQVNIVILDACRNNPFTRGFRSATRGLASMDAGKGIAAGGTIIAYATSAGSTASDGKGKNGVFTEEFSENVLTPGLKIEEVFKKTARGVREKTAGAQVPFLSTSVFDDIYLASDKTSEPVEVLPVKAETLPTQDVKTENDTVSQVEQKPDNETQPPEAKRQQDKPTTSFTGVPSEPDKDNHKFRKILLLLSALALLILIIVFRRSVNPFKRVKHPQSENSEALLGHNQEKDESLDNLNTEEAVTDSTYTDTLTQMEFVLVKGGCYMMGDTFGGGGKDEKPVHEVCVGSFYMGKYVVTQEQWTKIMSSNPSKCAISDNYPVERVSWNYAKEFIRKLNNKTGSKYRLPTEAEWEYACRSGGKDEMYSGGSDVDKYAWYDENSGDKTHPAGQKQPNGLGLFDMSGNVWEWVEDVYAEDSYTKHSKNNPIYTGAGINRVVRGGSWLDTQQNVRCSYRGSIAPDRGHSNIGFRLVFTM